MVVPCRTIARSARPHAAEEQRGGRSAQCRLGRPAPQRQGLRMRRALYWDHESYVLQFGDELEATTWARAISALLAFSQHGLILEISSRSLRFSRESAGGVRFGSRARIERCGPPPETPTPE